MCPVDSPGKDGSIFAFYTGILTANRSPMRKFDNPSMTITYDAVENRTNKNFHDEIIISIHNN